MEETGIESEFVSLLCFRQKHDYKFGRSDLYFICIMKAKTLDIRPCPNEVKACQWMKIEDFASHPDVTDTNRFIIKSYMESLKHEHHIVPTDVLDYRRKITQPIYSIKAQTDY
ncbi:uncharacterized protein LOC102804215 [Saccoglossus kowalevskii]|uniref:Nudix hydrolase 10-like n=1 Tax=Saccoglossus kowalevskii TaxID=10224 RepID=A0ABM0MJD4_SACKO|nr:PREDICTED: nudix hydrolase 10-like [Saccoglossus kowalevskii]